MKRALTTALMLLFTLTLLLFPLALAQPVAPLCRVQAAVRPLSWASSLRSIAVSLTPDCPPNGVARIRLGGYGGPGSRATGPTETLSAARPLVIWAAQPSYRTVLWLSQSGIPYPVPLKGVRRAEETK